MSTPTRSTVLPLVALLVVLQGACAGAEEEERPETIDSERFVETFVDLRLAARRSAGSSVPEAVRDSILEAHGVTADELLEFARIRGSRPREMSPVWDSVELRLLRRTRAADTIGNDTLP